MAPMHQRLHRLKPDQIHQTQQTTHHHPQTPLDQNTPHHLHHTQNQDHDEPRQHQTTTHQIPNPLIRKTEETFRTSFLYYQNETEPDPYHNQLQPSPSTDTAKPTTNYATTTTEALASSGPIATTTTHLTTVRTFAASGLASPPTHEPTDADAGTTATTPTTGTFQDTSGCVT